MNILYIIDYISYLMRLEKMSKSEDKLRKTLPNWQMGVLYARACVFEAGKTSYTKRLYQLCLLIGKRRCLRNHTLASKRGSKLQCVYKACFLRLSSVTSNESHWTNDKLNSRF